MTKTDEIFDALYEETQRCLAPNGTWQGRTWKRFPDLRKRIKEADLIPHETLDEKLYALRYNVRFRPVCAICGGKVSFKSQTAGYFSNLFHSARH